MEWKRFAEENGAKAMIINLPYPLSDNRIRTVIRGRINLTTEARKWKENAAWMAKEQGAWVTEVPVVVNIDLHPKLTKRGKASKKLVDLDNAIKATLDSLNGIAWLDDRQVQLLTIAISTPVAEGGMTVTVYENYDV